MSTNQTGYIYCLISPTNSRYIGQTWDLQRRWNSYKRLDIYLQRQPKLYNAIKKYGIENFEHEILDFAFTQETLDDAEIYWINYYNSILEGYNLRAGGREGYHSPETAELLRQNALKYWQENPISEERRAKMRECGARAKGKMSLENREKARQRRILHNKSRVGIPRAQEAKEKVEAWRTSEANPKLKHYEISNTITQEKVITNNLRAFCRDHKISFDRMLAKATRRVPNTGEWIVTRIDPPPVASLIKSQEELLVKDLPSPNLPIEH